MHDTLEVLPAGDARALPATGGVQAASLQKLYTKHVIPDSLLRLWNHGTARLLMVAEVASTLEDARERIRNEWVGMCLTDVLQIDKHPTLTRFFTL